MRWRRLMWLLLSVLVVALLWRSGRNGLWPGRIPFRLLILSAGTPPAVAPAGHSRTPAKTEQPGTHTRLDFRLSNTSKPLAELLRSDRAVLLENALLDTGEPIDLPIPVEFRHQGQPGSYIVQARSALDDAFRMLVESAGAKLVAYIPNNAYLVRAAESVAQNLAANPQTRAVLPFEPYYKVKLSLLEAASSSSPSTPLALNLLLFPDTADATIATLRSYGADILSEESSPFGRVLKIRAARGKLNLLAAMPEVEALELSRNRVKANDLSRARIGVAPDSISPLDYLGLTGTNVIVNVNDTGLDTNQPEFSGRVLIDTPVSGTDTNGHGTHVAGIIASSGSKSLTVSNAPGSSLPPAGYQFRGQAPGATIFAIATGLDAGPAQSDAYLQQRAAETNAFISNNSWHYSGDNEYDLAAASYDAAVRDALPSVPGSQPLLYVFAAGNVGQGKADGTGGMPDTIQSPATGKNVITVGAVEQPRFITNQTWTCTGVGGASNCVTNSPWLGLTDSSNEVAAFSSRGNVGIGIEGELGRLKPDLVAPGTFVLSTRSTQWDEFAYYAQTNNFVEIAPDTNYYAVLSNLNESAGPYYRFESGTSLAAAEVSGALALMQEFFEQRLGWTNSPALMKALLINGARSLGRDYGTPPSSTTNAQGWGLIHLPNSLPGALSNLNSNASAMLLFDQSPQDSLATRQRHTRYLSVSAVATNLPLRLTLVWTDPPGNPVAGVKLVNDLDLIVTNLDTGEVFLGNDMAPGSNFNQPWAPSNVPNTDPINNVENVFLRPGLGEHYSVTVLGQHVNVNAVTAHTNGVVQDYALVVSSGNGEIADALTVTDSPAVLTNWTTVTILTNTFGTSAGDTGAMALKERVGSGSPLLGTHTTALGGNTNTLLTLGTANQWRFYICTNTTGFTNAAFLTFLTPPLATPADLGSAVQLSNSASQEADIDMYISTNAALTNLDPVVLAAADASLGRGGNEMIVYSNATPGPYYVGIKCESGDGAEYGFLATFSQQPFFASDGLGNDILRGFPAPEPIPSGTANMPGRAYLFCLDPDGSLVRRVVATNTLTHPEMSELVGTLTHGSAFATLNNHSTNGPVTSQMFVYDDSGEGDIPGSQPTDGPGSLQVFAGHAATGQWRLSMASTNQEGSDDSFGLFIENQPDLTAGIDLTLMPGACRQDFLYLPAGVTNITASANLVSGGPVSWQLYPDYAFASNCPTVLLQDAPTNAVIVIDNTSQPPINPGRYVFRLCNSGPVPASVNFSTSLGFAPGLPSLTRLTSSQPAAIVDDAISLYTIDVTNTQRVLAAEVGVRIDHPRISDLALTLISPNGTRVLLDENRGGFSPEGMGLNMIVTNLPLVKTNGGPEALTNSLDTGQTSGTLTINYKFYSEPDDMRIYYEGQLLYDSGLVSFDGATNINYGPGTSTIVTIIMNEGGNSDPTTAWYYEVTGTHWEPLYLTFTENTNLTAIPIKLAPVPFTNVTYSVPGFFSSNAIYYLPEESLDRVAGQSALGRWTLEIRDARAGPSSPAPRLVSWQLSFLLQNPIPTPIPLVHDQPSTNLLGPGQLQWFSVDAPSWLSFVTNSILSANLPVNLLFNPSNPPTGTNVGDVALLQNSTSNSYTLQTNGLPPLIPGSRYYLAVQNTNAATVEFVFEVTFDVTNVVTLQSGKAYAAVNPGPFDAVDYYRYVVTNGVRAQFEINDPSTNLLLLARKGRLPSLSSYDYISANPGTNDELIVLYNYSSPVALAPGEWFLAAVNLSGGLASYSIMATEFPIYGTNLLIVNPVAEQSSFCFSWNSLPAVHYYVQGKASLADGQWTTLSPTLTAVDVLTAFCIPLPSAFHFFRVNEGLVVTQSAIISSISWSTNGVVLQWAAEASDKFNVQWTSSMLIPNWSSFANPVTSTNGAFFFLDDGSQSSGLGASRYYRLEQLP